jgi:hypothetical protein
MGSLYHVVDRYCHLHLPLGGAIFPGTELELYKNSRYNLLLENLFI